MTSAPRILAVAGSLRAASFNRRLVRIAAAGAKAAGAEVTELDLREHPLPVFDQDLEAREGPPEAAVRLKSVMKAHEGLLIAAPEYNSSITGVLKNAIDWASRPAEGEPRLACFAGKVAAIMSASPGALGGLRGLVHVRSILSNLGVLVVPQQLSVPDAGDAFTEDGALQDEKKQQQAEALGKQVADLVARLGR